MKVIHRLMRAASVLLILLAILISQVAAGAVRHPNKAEKRHRDAKPKTNKVGRAERRRNEARKRAEAVRLAALARQRAAEEAMRTQVQSMIAKDDTAGEDLEIRRIAVKALGNHAGTVVVMNPKTGRVYSIVNQQWALREGFKPCSTIKLVTGLAGLNEKVIDPADTTAISHSNRVSLTSALAHSKNEYFQSVGGQVGFSKLISYAHLLGLGEKTGINVRNETAGRVPKLKTGFAVNHMSSHGDNFKVTALQLATLVSAMANGGKLLSPFVARTPQDENRSTPKVRRLIDIDSDSFQQMVPGMIGSVKYGSGRLAFDPQATVAGKTGTCTENGTWTGLFTSYAPLNNPEFAIAVIARGNDGRNHFPAAVAGRIYRELNSRMAASTPIDVASKQTQAISTSDADVDAGDDEEEADDSAEEVSNSAAGETAEPTRPVWGDQRRPIESKVKPTLMALPSQDSSPTKNASTNERLRRAGEKRQ
jgi:penicillin-binding protein 2